MIPLRARSVFTLHRTARIVFFIVVAGVILVTRFSVQATSGDIPNANSVAQAATPCPDPTMQARFMDQWRSMIKDASGTVNPNGYLKVIGTDLIPYHSVETFMIEAPDQGHEMSSETWSYMLWLTAEYANYTGDFSYFQNTWNAIEKYSIPTAADQPNGGNPSATYAGEFVDPSSYPGALNSGVPTGQDPFLSELSSTYGNRQIYGMHWLFDADNFYGFGNHNDGTSPMAYINTFQRGPNESTWETIPQPSWDTEKWGQRFNGNTIGFGPYFVGGTGGAAQKYSYTDAPDADARAVQATYLAQQAAAKWGVNLGTFNAKAAKIGDFLRYAMAEKYFKAIPCATMSTNCPGGSGKNMLHYLISWYYAWGGDASSSHSWSWRIGDYSAHFGYQNPMAAWALSTDPNFKPASPSASTDWATSLSRQLDFYQWLQSAEGAIGGGAEFGQVSSTGSYTAAPAGTPKFNGMTYVANPVYLDPGSNTWFGFQAWSMQRLAEYYFRTGSPQAGAILNKWVNWLKTGNVFRFVSGTHGEDVQVASTISWSGAPVGDFNSGSGQPPANLGLHVTIVNYGSDMGTMASAANALSWYAAATGKFGTLDTAARDLAKRVLDAQWNNHRDTTGVVASEARADYSRFDSQVVFFPPGSTGTTPKCTGDCLVPGATFKSIRPQYVNDPDFTRVEAANAAGVAPTFTYHRFWAQSDVALANAFWGDLFGQCTGTPTPTFTPTVAVSATATKTSTPTFTATIGASATATRTSTRTFTPVVGASSTPTRTSTATATATTGVIATSTNTATPTQGVTFQPPTTLKVQLQNGGADSNQQSQFNFRVVNTGTSAQSSISVRIYIQLDGSQPISKYVIEKYWDQSGAASVSGPTLATGSIYYYTISFGSASLAAGNSWQYNGALHLSDWTNNFSAGNDWWHSGYAVGALPSAFTDTNFIPAYVGASLVWGRTP